MATSYMEREITEQPTMLRTQWQRWEQETKAISRRVRESTEVIVVGRGSSGNACLFFTYVFCLQTGRHVIDFRPWLATSRVDDKTYANAVVLAYSVSGQSTDIAQACVWLKAKGAYIVGITNFATDKCCLGDVAHELLHLGIGQEIAVPATKSFNAQLFISAACAGLPLEVAAEETAAAFERILEGDSIDKVVNFMHGARACVFLGRGPVLAAAQDACLKFQETAGILALAYSTAEFLHGPIGSMTDADRVILMQDGDSPDGLLVDIERGIASHKTPFLVLGKPVGDSGNSVSLALPTTPWARVPALIFAAQCVALRLTQKLGRNPDSPLGLKKVTIT